MPPKGRPASAAPGKDEQVLGMKEQTLFKQVLRFYETKQYKKGLKAADAILKKNPNHGETLAMKGLTYNCLNKKDEAHALVKKGLAMNIKSYVCWHVYGLLYRSEGKYDDAVKCYQNALKRDPENLQILKDLANLQIQRRMLPGFLDTRRRILSLKSNNRHNWLAYAIANHLVGNYEQALSVLETFSTTQGLGARAPNDKRPPSIDESELRLYHIQLLADSNKPEQALEELKEKEWEILDDVELHRFQGQLLFATGKKDESTQEFSKLLEILPENYEYHLGYLRAKDLIPDDATSLADEDVAKWNLSKEQGDKLLDLYANDAFLSKLKATSILRLPLTFAMDEAAFRKVLIPYIRRGISRGIPSLFSDLSSLYVVPFKSRVVGEVILEMVECLKEGNRFHADEEKESQSPSALMYALYFAAQHFDFIHDPVRALSYADACVNHTPTAPDVYMLKARIYKHAGDAITAYGYMDIARRLDTQDRYLNTKCVRYALRANEVNAAEEIVQLFLRDGDGLKALDELQVCWYLNSAAESHMRQRDWGRALKKLLSVDKTFNDWVEDQFDFHTYCLRKSTLRAYVEMIRWGDGIRGQAYHVRAAKNLVRVYKCLHEERVAEEKRMAALSEEERKAEEKKARKARAVEEKAAAEKEAAAKKSGSKSDPDPDGSELVKNITDPLLDASKYIRYLADHHSQSLDTHLLACSIFQARSKPLLVLRHLKKALDLAPHNPKTHEALCTFLVEYGKDGNKMKKGTMNDIVKQVIESEIATPAFGNGANVSSLNSTFLSTYGSTSPAARLAAGRVMLLLDRDPSDSNVVSKVRDLVSQLSEKDETTREDLVEILDFLSSPQLNTPKEVVETFKSAALKRFPFATAFGAVPAPPPPIDAPEEKKE